MKRTTVVFVILGAWFTLCTPNAFAWGTTGHRTVAELAEHHLSCRARHQVKKLLDGQSMAYWANWADGLRSDNNSDKWKPTFPWHYVNAPAHLGKDDYIAYIKNIKEENLYSEIIRLAAVLKDKKAPQEERATALKFIIHLVGDAHQPLHAGRAEDLGGNNIPVKWFGDETNLHTLWDSKLIDFKKYSYTEYANILDVCSRKQRKEMQKDTVADWLYHSHALADQLYDDIKPHEKLSYKYIYKYDSVLDSQLQQAGFHLAQILNDAF